MRTAQEHADLVVSRVGCRFVLPPKQCSTQRMRKSCVDGLPVGAWGRALGWEAILKARGSASSIRGDRIAIARATLEVIPLAQYVQGHWAILNGKERRFLMPSFP